jgi:hypothetical protein
LHESTSLDFDDRGSGGHDACHTHWPRLSDCESARNVIQGGYMEWGKARVACAVQPFVPSLSAEAAGSSPVAPAILLNGSTRRLADHFATAPRITVIEALGSS